MNGFGESSKPWGGDSSAPSEPAYSKDGSWKDLGTSMSAISFGLAATAILIAMFLVMAIFEHVIKPRASFLRPRSIAQASREVGQPHGHTIAIEKLQNTHTVSSLAPLVQFGFKCSRRRKVNEPTLAGFGRRLPCFDAGAGVSYLHCSTFASSVPKGGHAVAFPRCRFASLNLPIKGKMFKCSVLCRNVHISSLSCFL
ncbi:hypothetical protein ZIOFF_040274 [Zingiber officinale]|uniref:Uncharacterized protein n=1 Tax=Zingiber officinale TaxID=94328 RepID=A0A8J5G8J4_ZINOF|nr:hypothetical protein ZIOFF_040274 [Zingiber officinale]